MGDKNNFYVMDDDYIEQKYVRAEEERQRMEEEQRRQRELDEARAFQEAERQRKAADAERKRRQEESDRAAKLEEARKRREQQDRLRKEKEKGYQDRLEQIEKDLKAIELKKANFINDKIDLAKEHGREEDKLKGVLEDILEEKRTILDREQQARYALESFQAKARGQTMALDQDEESTHARQKALTQERRDVQNEMLAFLQNPNAVEPPEETATAPTPISVSVKPEPVLNPAPTAGLFSYAQNQPMMMHPSAPPMYNMPAQMPNYNFNYNPTPVSKPDYPTFNTGVFATPANNAGNSNNATNNNNRNQPNANKSKSSLDEQLEMLDDLLRQGIMTKDEYEANKKEALKAAGIEVEDTTPARANNSNNANNAKKAEVDKQIAQLDEYLRTGVLQREDYEDAKQRVLADAGLSNSSAQNSGSANIPVAQIPAGGKTLVMVVVPQGKRPGDKMVIKHQGREFQVIVPQGVSPGMQFHASVPV